jgi:hypothetical protein
MYYPRQRRVQDLKAKGVSRVARPIFRRTGG